MLAEDVFAVTGDVLIKFFGRDAESLRRKVDDAGIRLMGTNIRNVRNGLFRLLSSNFFTSEQMRLTA